MSLEGVLWIGLSCAFFLSLVSSAISVVTMPSQLVVKIAIIPRRTGPFMYGPPQPPLIWGSRGGCSPLLSGHVLTGYKLSSGRIFPSDRSIIKL